MPLDETENDSCKLEEPNETLYAPSLLFSLPFELREQIYVYYFASIHARRIAVEYYRSNNELAILGTCTKLQKEASSVLFDRIPLRLIVSAPYGLASKTPSRKVIDRFRNVHFTIGKCGGTDPEYNFRGYFEPHRKALTLPSSPASVPERRSCHIQCDLLSYVSGFEAEHLRDELKSFTAFETVTIDFEGACRRSQYRKPPNRSQDKVKISEHYWHGSREVVLWQESKALAEVGNMLRKLEPYLGKGKMYDIAEGSDLLYAKRIEFHPLLDKNETTTTISGEDA